MLDEKKDFYFSLAYYIFNRKRNLAYRIFLFCFEMIPTIC